MKRSFYVACGVSLLSVVFVAQAEAAKGVKKIGNHTVRGTVISVNRNNQGVGNFGNATMKTGTIHVKTARHHRKVGGGGNFANAVAGGQTHTFHVHPATQFTASRGGRMTSSHFGAVHNGEHVLINHTNQQANQVTIMMSSRHRTYNRNYNQGVYRRRSYSNNYAHHHHHHRAITSMSMPVATTPPASKPSVASKPPTVKKVAAKPQPKKVAHNPVTNKKAVVKQISASRVASSHATHHHSSGHHMSAHQHSAHHHGKKK